MADSLARSHPERWLHLQAGDHLCDPFCAGDHQQGERRNDFYSAGAGTAVPGGEIQRVEELRRHYDAVIFTSGAETDRKMGIPGEDQPRDRF